MATTTTATVDDGGCPGPYRCPIVIRHGVVDASGRAGADGRIVGIVRRGLASVAVRGRLSAAEGRGDRTLSGPLRGSGRWTSRRSG